MDQKLYLSEILQSGWKKRRKDEDLVKQYLTEQAEKVILFLVSDQQPPLFKEHLAGPKAVKIGRVSISSTTWKNAYHFYYSKQAVTAVNHDLRREHIF